MQTRRYQGRHWKRLREINYNTIVAVISIYIYIQVWNAAVKQD